MRKFIFCLLVVSSTFLFAQITLFEDNKSGFDISYYRGTGHRTDLNSFTIGYTINSKLNIGFDANYYNYRGYELYGFDLHLDFSIIKQNEKMPINLITGIYYDYNCGPIIESDFLYRFIGLRTEISHSFKIDKDISIVPIAELQFLYEDRLDYETGRGSVNYLFRPLVKCVINYKNIFIYPELSYSYGYYFSGGLGFIIPTNLKRKNN